jgi:hypothetical protein
MRRGDQLNLRIGRYLRIIRDSCEGFWRIEAVTVLRIIGSGGLWVTEFMQTCSDLHATNGILVE